MHHPSHPTIHQRNYAFPQTHYNALNKPEDPTPKFITNYKKSTTYTSVITQIPPPQLNQARRYHPSLSPTESNTNISPKSTLPKIQLIKLSLALIQTTQPQSNQPMGTPTASANVTITKCSKHLLPASNKTETPKIDLQYLTQNKTTVAASTSSDRGHAHNCHAPQIPPCNANFTRTRKPKNRSQVSICLKRCLSDQQIPHITIAPHKGGTTSILSYLPSTYKVNPHNPSTITEYPGDKYHHSQPKINMKLMKIVDLLPISVLGSHTRKISCTNPQSHQIHVNRYLNSQLRHIPHTKHSSPSYPKPESSVQVQTQTNNPLTARAHPCPNEPLKRNHDCKPKITKNLGSQTPSTSTVPKITLQTKIGPKTQITTKLKNLKNYRVTPLTNPYTRVYPQTRKHSIFKNRNNKHTTSKSPWLQTP
eukprot:gene3045-2027_t